MNIRTIGIAGALLLAAGSLTAMAADLPANVPVYKAPAAVPAFSWTGFYLGGHVGGGSAATDASSVPGGLGLAGVDTTLWGIRGSGILGGFQAGFNWQLSPNWVIGIEGDGTWTGIKDGLSGVATTGGVPIVGSAETISRDIRWLATVRGRIGLTFDRWMIFGTGGGAFGGLNFTANSSFGAGAVTFPFAGSSNRTGWVAGGGVQYAVSNNWLLRGEYLFYRLNGSSGIGPASVAGFPGTYGYSWSDTNIHTARFGIDYKFGQ